MLRGIQILGVLVGIYLIIRSYLLTRKRQEDINQFLIWIVIGLLITVGSVFPGILSYIADILNMQERVYTLFIIAFIFIFLLLMNLFKQNRKIMTEISKLNEEQSLLKFELSKKSKRKK